MPRPTTQICPDGRFACQARDGAIISSPLRGLVGGWPAGNLRAEKKGLVDFDLWIYGLYLPKFNLGICGLYLPKFNLWICGLNLPKSNSTAPFIFRLAKLYV